MEKLAELAALGGKSDQGKSSNISDSEQPMPDYADNRCVICGALATTEYEHEPSCGKPSCEYQIQESIDAIGDIGADV